MKCMLRNDAERSGEPNDSQQLAKILMSNSKLNVIYSSCIIWKCVYEFTRKLGHEKGIFQMRAAFAYREAV